MKWTESDNNNDVISMIAEFLQDNPEEEHLEDLVNRIAAKHNLDYDTAKLYKDKAVFKNSLDGQYWYLLKPAERIQADKASIGYFDYFTIQHVHRWSDFRR